MSLGYRIAYRVGLTPWERAGQAATEQFTELLDREEADRTPPLGRALDIGCGTGLHTIELAQRGWDAVGADNVGRAISKARRRVRAQSATFVVGDVTDLGETGVGIGFEFVLDVGCFHGLGDRDRAALGAGVTAAAKDTATLLMLAFQPGRRPPLPRGADRQQIEAAYPEWAIEDVQPADTSGMPGPLKATRPQWYLLRRAS